MYPRAATPTSPFASNIAVGSSSNSINASLHQSGARLGVSACGGSPTSSHAGMPSTPGRSRSSRAEFLGRTSVYTDTSEDADDTLDGTPSVGSVRTAHVARRAEAARWRGGSLEGDDEDDYEGSEHARDPRAYTDDEDEPGAFEDAEQDTTSTSRAAAMQAALAQAPAVAPAARHARSRSEERPASAASSSRPSREVQRRDSEASKRSASTDRRRVQHRRHSSDASTGSHRHASQATTAQVAAAPAALEDPVVLEKRMSVLGPKIRMIQPAPWDLDALAEGEDDATDNPRTSSSTSTSQAAALESNIGSSSAGEHRSGSAWPFRRKQSDSGVVGGARKENVAPENVRREREQVVRGHGLPGAATAVPPTTAAPAAPVAATTGKSRLVRTLFSHRQEADHSFIDMGPSPPHKRPARKSSKSSPPRQTEYPRSAPAHVLTFDAAAAIATPRERSDSLSAHGHGSSNKLEIPTPLAGNSPAHLRSLSHGNQGQSSPNGVTPSASGNSLGSSTTPSSSAPTTPRVNMDGYFPATSAAAPPHPSMGGRALMTLEEARAAHGSRSPEPVFTRERSSSGPLAPVPPPAEAKPQRALKNKKSGFLKRMMGAKDESGGSATPPTPPLPPSPRTVSAPAVAVTSDEPVARRDPQQRKASLAPAPSGRLQFVDAPVPPREPMSALRARKDLAAPSLSLRPVSMAFSAGFASDFLAREAAAAEAERVKQAEIERKGSASSASRLPISAASTNEPLRSPCASSFTASSAFDSDLVSLSSASHSAHMVSTPLTPAFTLASPPASDGLSSPEASLSRRGTNERNKAQQQSHLESQNKALQAECERLSLLNAELVQQLDGDRVCPPCQPLTIFKH